MDGVLLAELVLDASADDLVRAVRHVWRNNELRTLRLGKVLCDATLANDSRREVRDEFARISDDDDTLWCVGQLIEANTQDIRWLLETPNLGDRRGELLNEVIGRSCHDDLITTFVDSGMATQSPKNTWKQSTEIYSGRQDCTTSYRANRGIGRIGVRNTFDASWFRT